MSKVLHKKKHYIIPNGVSLTDFFPIEQNIARRKVNHDSKKKLVIFISDPPGREEKNISLLQDAFKLLDITSIELLCLSGLKKEDINFYYSAADALALTSLHEGSPNVIKEAMACGCPIVSTDVGDVRYNTSGVEGCYVASFDPADVAAKIKLAVNFGRTDGRNKLIGLRLDSDSSTNKLIDVYADLLNETLN
jgi:glycosyltransferase involved in cell wall biosynthesis